MAGTPEVGVGLDDDPGPAWWCRAGGAPPTWSTTCGAPTHAGHLDVVRELIDGRVGLGPR